MRNATLGSSIRQRLRAVSPSTSHVLDDPAPIGLGDDVVSDSVAPKDVRDQPVFRAVLASSDRRVPGTEPEDCGDVECVRHWPHDMASD